MPRKNKRKACEYRWKDYCKQSSKQHQANSQANNRSMENAVCRMLYENKPSKDRHKAPSDNKRKRRARQQIRSMQRSADRVMKRYHLEYCHFPDPEQCEVENDHSAVRETFVTTGTVQEQDAATTLTADETETNDNTINHTNSILGGFAAWLKGTLHSTTRSHTHHHAPRRG